MVGLNGRSEDRVTQSTNHRSQHSGQCTLLQDQVKVQARKAAISMASQPRICGTLNLAPAIPTQGPVLLFPVCLRFPRKGLTGLQGTTSPQNGASVSTCGNTTNSSLHATISSWQLSLRDTCHTRLLLAAKVPFREKAGLCL